MTAFDRAWEIAKGEDPVVEFGGNNICPDCGNVMEQKKNQLGFGFPVVYGWGCENCESFRPHDIEYAQTPQKIALCPHCKGSGEQSSYNKKRDSYECEHCDGDGAV